MSYYDDDITNEEIKRRVQQEKEEDLENHLGGRHLFSVITERLTELNIKWKFSTCPTCSTKGHDTYIEVKGATLFFEEMEVTRALFEHKGLWVLKDGEYEFLLRLVPTFVDTFQEQYEKEMMKKEQHKKEMMEEEKSGN